MFEEDNFDRVLTRLKTKGYLKEFINKTFNYKLGKNCKFDLHLQKIDGIIILYIYERNEKNQVNAYEFIDDDNDVYMEKAIYKGAIINTIHMKKCIKMYEENVILDNIIIFVNALKNNNPKKILLEYLDKKIVDEILKND